MEKEMAAKTSIVRDTEFKKYAENVKPDTKNRVNLRGIRVPEGVIFHIYRNRSGQIVLDPQVTVPAAEAWLFNNTEALSSVRRGLIQAKQGKVTRVKPEEL